MSGTQKITGGCQCGAVRYEIKEFGRATICHCRMCQKAFGGLYAPLVTGLGINWVHREPKYFQSSSKVQRGFCEECGTPLTYDFEGTVAVSIGSLDNPELVTPILQFSADTRVSYVDDISKVPHYVSAKGAPEEDMFSDMISYQHPDHPIENWSVDKIKNKDK